MKNIVQPQGEVHVTGLCHSLGSGWEQVAVWSLTYTQALLFIYFLSKKIIAYLIA